MKNDKLQLGNGVAQVTAFVKYGCIFFHIERLVNYGLIQIMCMYMLEWGVNTNHNTNGLICIEMLF